jgi:uracil-DNA glycosylase
LIAAAEEVKTACVTLSVPPAPPRGLQAGDIAAALDWWREAGVDQDFSDAARDWLESRAPAVTEAAVAAPEQFIKPPAPAAPPLGGSREHWPQELAAFTAWWLSEPSLDAGQVFGRVAPRGPQNALLMVLVDHPEAGDSQVLLSGEQGRLVHAILAAIGIAPDQAYVASVLPRHMPMPDWSALTAAGLGQIALHHIALAAPQRVISFGANVSSLLGHDPAKSADPLQQFYHVGPSIPALAAPGLTTLMARPRGKAALWQALLDWQHG